MQQDTGLYANANWFTYALFAQDDWRIRTQSDRQPGHPLRLAAGPDDTQVRQTNFTPGVQSQRFRMYRSSARPARSSLLSACSSRVIPVYPAVEHFTPNNSCIASVGFAYDPMGTVQRSFHGQLVSSSVASLAISGNSPRTSRPCSSQHVQARCLSTHPYAGDPTEFRRVKSDTRV